MTTNAALNITVGIASFLTGIGICTICQRMAANASMPRGLRWITVERIVYAFMVLLVISSMLTTVSYAECQRSINEQFINRYTELSGQQTFINNAHADTYDLFLRGGLSGDEYRNKLRELRDALRNLEEEKKNLPLPNPREC